MSRPDKCADKIVKQTLTQMSNSSGYRYLTQLCTSLTRQKRDINPVLVYCWVSVADDGSILNEIGLTYRVCCRRGERDYLLDDPRNYRVSKTTVQSIL